jgi:hypothetical protein
LHAVEPFRDHTPSLLAPVAAAGTDAVTVSARERTGAAQARAGGNRRAAGAPRARKLPEHAVSAAARAIDVAERHRLLTPFDVEDQRVSAFADEPPLQFASLLNGSSTVLSRRR